MPVTYTIIKSKTTILVVCFINALNRLEQDLKGSNLYNVGTYWYNNACKRLRLKHIIYDTELTNLMERFIQQIKDRTECFDEYYPCKCMSCKIYHLNEWTHLFMFIRSAAIRHIKFTIMIILRRAWLVLRQPKEVTLALLFTITSYIK